MIETLEKWAITITFRQQLIESPVEALPILHRLVDRVLRHSTVYEIYPELHKASGHIHFHGIIQVSDKIKYYKSTLPKLKRLGFILIKTKIDKGWMTYILKDQYWVKQLFVDTEFPLTRIKLIRKQELSDDKSVVINHKPFSDYFNESNVVKEFI